MGLRQMLARLIGERNQAHDSGSAVATATAPREAIEPSQDKPDPAKNIDESALVEELFRADTGPGVMIDVGAHFGSTTKPFLEMGWKVIGFEPDPKKHTALKEIAQDPNFTLMTCAVGDKPQEDVPFFTSQESTGIASLVPFRETHTEGPRVQIRTLREVLKELDVDHIDYLKIDAEGFDLRVLEGFPFESIKPRAVMCEFEDGKTNNIGYSTHDLGKHLQSLGYKVYMSEWYPIVRYGITHRWRCIKSYPCDLADANGWGNFVAVLPGKTDEQFQSIMRPWA
ncbi:MAG: hypothetical protein Phyf2KO_05610 [Phycisphaerales bacterium]